jgi:hypothetical protein
VSLFVYKWVRQHPRRFLVRPGHERPAFGGWWMTKARFS